MPIAHFYIQVKILPYLTLLSWLVFFFCGTELLGQSEPFKNDSVALMECYKTLGQHSGEQSLRFSIAQQANAISRRHPIALKNDVVRSYLYLSENSFLPDSMVFFLLMADSLIRSNAGEPLDSVVIKRASYSQGIYFEKMGAVDKAIHSFSKFAGEARPKTQADKNSVYLAYHHLGQLYYNKGEFHKAIKQFDIGHSFLPKNLPYHTLRGHSYMTKATTFLQLKDSLRAFKFLEDAEEIFLHETSGASLQQVYQIKSNFFQENKQLKKSMAYMNRAIDADSSNSVAVVALRIKRGQLFLLENDFPKAEADFYKAIAVLEEINDQQHFLKGNIYIALGESKAKQKQLKEALNFYHQAIAQFVPGDSINLDYQYQPDYFDSPVKAELLKALQLKANALLELYHENKKETIVLRTALETLKTGVNLILLLQQEHRWEKVKTVTKKSYDSFIEQAIAVAFLLDSVEHGDGKYFEEALQIVEQSKAITLLESLRSNKVVRFKDVPEKIIEKERHHLSNKIYFQKEWLNQQLNNNPINRKKTAAYLKESTNAYNKHLTLIRQEYPNYYQLKYALTSVSKNSLQALSTRVKTTFLEFYTGSNHLYLFVVGKHQAQIRRIAKRSDFDADIQTLLSLTTSPLYSERQLFAYQQISNKIYLELFEGIDLPNAKWTIIPDGLLSLIPFEAFVMSSESVGDCPLDFLLFEKTISYAYSAEQLQQNFETEPLDTRSVIAFAPFSFEKFGLVPLKGTPGHLLFLERKFNCRTLVDSVATKIDFQNQWIKNEHNILILATHADAGQYPWICFHDEKLSWSELFDLKIKTNLMVLNSCNVDVTSFEKGQGALSLAGRFNQAGVPSFVSPLWSVPQKMTLDVMEPFYLNLASGMRKDEAMAEAKIDYLKNYGQDVMAYSPHYWAGLVMVGNTDSIYTTSYLLPIIILILFFALVITWKSYQKRIA